MRSTIAAGGLLFLSGCAALICQVIWIKQLSLVVGVEVYAITTAVSAFFGGLALGGLIFGRIADRTGRPIRLYIALEAGIAVTALATTWALAHAAPVFAQLEAIGKAPAWAMVFALVGIPSLLMGGTLPMLVRALARDRDDAGRTGGGLYAANTAGAIMGALAPMFVLIPAFGVRGTAIAAAALNIAAAAGAVMLDRVLGASAPPPLLTCTGHLSVRAGALGHRPLRSRRRRRSRL